MVANVGNLKPFLRVRLEYLLNNVFVLCRYEPRNQEVARQNLLVQLVGVGVLKRQVAARHRVQDDPARPDVTAEAVVPLPCDHLGRSVARTATGCFEGLVTRIGI